MSPRQLALLFALTVVACVRSKTIQCADDRTCGPGSVCDDAHGLCVRPAQVTSCAQLTDGDPCAGAGFVGLCDRGYCVSGCSDGVVGYDWGRLRDEECDDGNRRSHDGCSSGCRTERAGWEQWRGPWQARAGASAVYDPDRDVLVMFGGVVQGTASADHWERDVDRRWRLIDISVPPARALASLAYDPVRRVLVLFGGVVGTARYDDTWEYDGTAWVEVMPPTRPSARSGAMMVFDTVRGKIVLFGGTDGAPRADTWEFDGITWTPITTIGAPPARSRAAIAWDAGRSRAVMFGGDPTSDDTWEWNGATATWTQLSTTAKPGSRFGAAMTYHPSSSALILHGGGRLGPILTYADMWSFDGTSQTWSQIVGPTSPPGRLGANLVFDPINARLVLVGGQPQGDVGFDDVWEYNFSAQAWNDQTPSFPPRQQARLVEDSLRGEIVALDRNGHTWVFDREQNWHNVSIETDVLFARNFFGIAYDPARDRVIAFGGHGAGNPACVPTATTIEWDGASRTWRPLAGGGPPGRTVPGMAYDPARNRIVLASGTTTVCAGGTAVSDTWELDTLAGTWASIGTSPELDGMVFDPVRAQMIALARNGATWTYDARGWTDLGLPPGPSTSGFGSLAFNPDRQKPTWFGGRPQEMHSDVWELHDDGWREVTVVGQQPVARSFPALVGHRASRALLLVGGSAFGTNIGDTWLFRYRTDDPDEICDDGEDNDADYLVDADDPDCD